MAYRGNCTLLESLLEQIAEQGLALLPEQIHIVINTTRQADRETYLRQRPKSGRTAVADIKYGAP